MDRNKLIGITDLGMPDTPVMKIIVPNKRLYAVTAWETSQWVFISINLIRLLYKPNLKKNGIAKNGTMMKKITFLSDISIEPILKKKEREIDILSNNISKITIKDIFWYLWSIKNLCASLSNSILMFNIYSFKNLT